MSLYVCVFLLLSLRSTNISAFYLHFLKALTRLLALDGAQLTRKYYRITIEIPSREEKASNEKRAGWMRRKLAIFSHCWPLFWSLDSKEHLVLDDKKKTKQNFPAISSIWIRDKTSRSTKAREDLLSFWPFVTYCISFYSVSGQGWRSSFLRANGTMETCFFQGKVAKIMWKQKNLFLLHLV